MRVLKFGGSSLATPERVEAVVEIVAEAAGRGPVAVVVSAFGGVTDALTDAAGRASRHDASWQTVCSELAARHRRAAETLAPAAERAGLDGEVARTLGELSDLLHGAWLVREASPRTRDRILSYGERLSAAIVAAALRRHGVAAVACDARRLIVTGPQFGAARVAMETTAARIREHFAGVAAGGGPLQVVTGFIGATLEDETTTLGRGGSDYTAALVGAALGAAAVELWTDVDGVMSADPRLVPAAAPIPRLSYHELMELSHFGAEVVHPPSVHPTRSAGVPLVIKNTFNPAAPGTRVAPAGDSGDAADDGDAAAGPVVGLASIHRVALLRLEGDGMIGVPGIAGRLFGALARAGVSVILISQASSEHSICFAVAPEAVDDATAAVGEEFELERGAGLIDELVVEHDLSVLAAVGSAMRERPGIGGRLFGVLGERGVNVRAIAQGSSERNVSLVVAAGDEARALNAVHGAFFTVGGPAPAVIAEIGVAGVGRVGGALLAQLAERAGELTGERGLGLRLVGVAGRRGLALAVAGDDGLDPATAAAALDTAADPAGAAGLAERLLTSPAQRRVFIDCTASSAVAALYDRLLAAGVAVVTANKLRLAGPWEGCAGLFRRRGDATGRLYYETTVGAGLPVVRTLAELLATGDRLVRVEGVLSGTLSYLMDRLEAGEAFSAALREAHRRGYTEPDPRQDLGGHDVARKLLILARTAGMELAPELVEVEPLLPAEPWADLDEEAFWQRLPDADDGFARRLEEAAAGGRRLRYLASLDVGGGARVSLTAVAADHPAAAVRGSDNLVAFTTARYADSPLAVHGPGAGPEVTAAGVFADLLRAVTEAPVGGGR